jgi:hypothetical protein
MIWTVIRVIRKLLAMPFIFVAYVLLPKQALKKATAAEEVTEVNAGVTHEESTVQFTDLQSYIDALKEPSDRESSAMLLCNSLKKLSEKKQMPVRLSIITETCYDKTGVTKESVAGVISGYSKDRWQRLRNVDNISATAIFPLMEEMIEAMAQEGWVCMNGSLEEINAFLSRSVPVFADFMKEHCKQRDTRGYVRIQTVLCADVSPTAGKIFGLSPSILVRVIAKLDERGPMESAHQIYFCKNVKNATKPPA